MAKKLHVYIPSLPQRSYEYRRGDSILIYDEDKAAVLIDGGERELFDRMEAFLRKNFTGSDGYAHVTQIITHWHGDHDCALKYTLESPHIFVDEIIAPDPEELKNVPRDDGYEEYNRAKKRLALAKDYNKKITFPRADKRVGRWVGQIRMWMYRQTASNADYVDYQVNNTSIQVFFPDLEFLTTGDAITAEDKFLKKFDWRVTGFKIPHHGNACTYSTCDQLTQHGAKICYYTDWEPSGTAIGNTHFSKYGAGRAKQYFTILRPFEDIYIDSDGENHVTWEQGGKSWTFDINSGVPIPEPEPEVEILPIIKKNTGFRGYNVSPRSDKIKYIVIHYTGDDGATAENEVKYFNTADRQASADFFVGHDGDIWQYNPEPVNQYSWHCGGSIESSHHPLHGICKNSNSLGVELCTRKVGGDWTFTDKTVVAAQTLVKYLMSLYGVPADNVVRHYDVTGKSCPRVPGWGAVGGSAEWDKFKAAISGAPAPAEGQIYRVRKSWADADSQLGAFSVLENARAMAAKHTGWKIFDSFGQEVV